MRTHPLDSVTLCEAAPKHCGSPQYALTFSSPQEFDSILNLHHKDETTCHSIMAAQIPPLLESYLSLPPETSQIVLTGILGASTNWLVLRYLHSLLKPGTTNHRAQHDGEGNPEEQGDVRVVLVSWMRDYAFWKDGAGRLVQSLFPHHLTNSSSQKDCHKKLIS